MRGSPPSKESSCCNTTEGEEGRDQPSVPLPPLEGRRDRTEKERNEGRRIEQRETYARVQASCNRTSSDVCRGVRHKETANGRSEKGFLVLESGRRGEERAAV